MYLYIILRKCRSPQNPTGELLLDHAGNFRLSDTLIAHPWKKILRAPVWEGLTPSPASTLLMCQSTSLWVYPACELSLTSSSSFYLNQTARPININKRHTDRQIDSVSERKKSNIRCTIKHSELIKMQTDTHIEVVSPDHFCACSRHNSNPLHATSKEKLM